MKQKRLIPENRRSKIVELIKVKNSISIPDLIDAFKVSEITIRRDLVILEKRGLIDKIYGGASKKDDLISEIQYLKQISTMVKEKRQIALECVKRIADGSTILLHGGTTCLEIAKNIDLKKNLKIITSFPPIIEYLWKAAINKKANFEIFCPGGKLHIASNLFTGGYSQVFFNKIIIDTAFIGVIALNLTDGFMVTTNEEANLLTAIISASKNIIATADHSKFNKSAFIKVGTLDKINEIITDKGLSNTIYEEYINKNIKIIRV